MFTLGLKKTAWVAYKPSGATHASAMVYADGNKIVNEITKPQNQEYTKYRSSKPGDKTHSAWEKKYLTKPAGKNGHQAQIHTTESL